MSNTKRGQRVARAIFELLPGTTRIAFRRGNWRTDSETDLGGLCEEALAENLTRIFDELGPESEPAEGT